MNKGQVNRGQHERKDRLIKEKRHDVYQERDKWPEPTICTKCHAQFINGHWSWNKSTEKAFETTCPACRRIADNYPAGNIEIRGEFFKNNRDEILNLIHNVERQEKEKHPLERIMSITDEKDHTVVKTTGIHIARRIGESMSRSYKGDFSFQYADGDNSIRVYWQR